MNDRSLFECSATQEERIDAVKVYIAHLADALGERFKLCGKKARVGVSEDGKTVLLGFFDEALAPGEDDNIWDDRPGNIASGGMAVVGGSDIFICKSNAKKSWTKHCGIRDAEVLAGVLFA